MAVISNLVRQIRDLRFERRTFVFFLARRRRIVKRLVLLQSFADFERKV